MRSVVFFAFILVCGFASADQKSCEVYATLAHNIMSGRQNGVSMKQSMNIAEKSGGSEELIKFIKGVVISAYEEPRYGTEQMKARAISDFEDKYFLMCTKA